MGSLHGSEGRADGVKIQRHLNAMNKQLLETNGELAREAEAWRSEVDRLRSMLVDAGVEVEDTDIMARLADRSRSPGTSSRSGSLGPPPSLGDLSRHSLSARQALAERRRSGSPTASASRMDRLDEVGQDEQIAIMQEMADKLEMLEQGLDEKDQLIADLEARLEPSPRETTCEKKSIGCVRRSSRAKRREMTCMPSLRTRPNSTPSSLARSALGSKRSEKRSTPILPIAKPSWTECARRRDA